MAVTSSLPSFGIGELCYLELADTAESRRCEGIIVEVQGQGEQLVVCIGAHLYKEDSEQVVDIILVHAQVKVEHNAWMSPSSLPK